jgi:uncharacterized protein
MTRRVDCDVHVAVPSLDALYPHLTRYWRDTLPNAQFKQPPAVANTYPPWFEPLATRGSEVTLERVRDDVLGDADRAILQCYYGLESIQHPYLAPALARAVNEWVQAEWLDKDERLLGSIAIAPHYPQDAVVEIERAARDPRFVQVLLPARSVMTYGHRIFWPIWEAAEANELVLAVAYGGGTGTPPTPVNWLPTYFENYVASALNFQAQVASLILSGVFSQFPGLKLALLESGWTWLPSLMWRMDKEWKSGQREVPWLSEPPSAYLRRHVRATTQPTDAPSAPDQLRRVLDELGSEDVLMFASDFPHQYPPPADDLLSVLTEQEREKVLWSNAVECYRLD